MIRYSLICKNKHQFEAWFSNAANYDNEHQEKRLTCPYCASNDVTKALMAPNIKTSKGKEVAVSTQLTQQQSIAKPALEDSPMAIRDAMQKVREFVQQNAHYVGDNFVEEARKIHYEEVEPRSIYGEASLKEVKDLEQEGIDTVPLPPAPEKQN